MAGASDFLKPGGVIERNTYGQGDKEGILIVEGLPDGKEEIEIQIKERQYSKKEADNKFGQAFQEVQKEALADNPSFDKVSSSLKLSSRLDSFGMTMKWESQNPELIDPEGEVYLEQMQKEQEKTVLFLTLKAGNYQRKYEIPVTVVKPVLTKQEKSLKLLADTIESADDSSGKTGGTGDSIQRKTQLRQIYIPSAGSCGCGTYGIQGKFSGKRREKEEEYGAGIGLFRYSIWFVRLSGSRFSSQESLGTAC